jgi:tellurite resistance protein TehA-like permease
MGETAADTGTQSRRVRRRSKKGYRRPPVSLPFAAVVAMVMSAMYLYRAFMSISDAIESEDMYLVATSFAFMLLFFAMFVRFVIALFRLPSGSRKAWATTVRMAISYIALTVLGAFGVTMLSATVDFGVIVIPSWAMSAVMVLLLVYMFIGEVRDFFTPSYAENVGIWQWIKYVAWIDPFSGRRMAV